MKLSLLVVVGIISLMAPQMETIPEEIWGKWVVSREIPTTTISCWSGADAKKLLGTEIEYSKEVFRWKDVVTSHPVAETRAFRFTDQPGTTSGLPVMRPVTSISLMRT
jgi:hypothetical protein